MFYDRERSLGISTYGRCRKGTNILHSTRYIDEQKGLIERAGRTIIEMARSMRIAAHLPEKLWPHIFQAAVYLHSRRPRREAVLDSNGKKEWIWITPYEKISGKMPSLANLRVFGCRAHVRHPKIARSKKLDSRPCVGYLLGFTASNIWKIWNPVTGKVTDERDVTFDEDILYGPFNSFHAEAIKISYLPELPVEINTFPDVDVAIGGVEDSSTGEDEVEPRGMKLNDAVNDEGGVPIKQAVRPLTRQKHRASYASDYY
jgi:hypothetical protein